MTEPTHYVAFERSEAEKLFQRLRELEEAFNFMTRDMGRISRNEVKDPVRFAEESVIGALMFMEPH